jgi:DNA primase catalytic subunit
MFRARNVPPEEQAKSWKTSIRAQRRAIERQMWSLEREEQRIKSKITPLIRQNQSEVAMPMVRSIAESRKTRSHLLKTCTQLDSLVRQIDIERAQVKVFGCFKQSTEITHKMNQVLRVPEIQQAAQQLNMEMQAADLLAETTNEALEMATEQEAPEDQELRVRLMYNEIAAQINKNAARPVALLPVDQAEIDADPDAAALIRG